MEKNKKPRKVKPKPVVTEEELIMKQAMRMQRDMHRLHNTGRTTEQKEKISTVDLWRDSDFFFSVVFQTSEQKYAFLKTFSKMFNLELDQIISNNEIVQIVNGLTLAKQMKINIPSPVGRVDYPYRNLELAEMALDMEEF